MQGLLHEPPASPARQQSRLEFRRLLEVMPAAAYTCDAQGLITYFNQRAVEIWGQQPKLNDPLDRYCGSFKLFTVGGSPISHDRCWMALALQENQGYNDQEIVIERPDGSRRTVLAHANPLYDESDRVVGAVNILVDITERKRGEDALKESDLRKVEFLAMLAHELRNPLAPLRYGLEIIRLANQNAAVNKARTMMERQLENMVRLIDDLLDLSRFTSGKIELRKERIDLAQAVQDAVEISRPLIEVSGHQLTVTLPPCPVLVNGDRTRLAQVFANLLNNSAKFTQPGGHLWLTVEQQGSEVVVKVSDDGVGIPADMLPNLFEMFTQGGQGIGLCLVRGLVEMHDGRVTAHSDGLDKGSEFVVHLPLLLLPSQGQHQGNAWD
jgi:PAS domain S-box-containing protein